MASYTHEAGSQFPERILSLHNYKDVTDEIAGVVNQAKDMMAAGNYKGAKELIESADLGSYLFSAQNVNLIEEETRNLEIFTKQTKQQIYYQDEEPTFATVGDVWIG